MVLISINEYAAYSQKSIRTIQNQCQTGKIRATKTTNDRNRPQYMIPITELTPEQQKEYYKSHSMELPDDLLPPPKLKKPILHKSIEQFTAAEREEINRWQHIVAEWQSFRLTADCGKTKANDMFVMQAKDKYPNIKISKDILYRKKKAIDEDNLSGLIDSRGKAKQGYSKVPDELVCLFNHLLLNEHMPVVKCYEAMEMQLTHNNRQDLIAQMPSVDTLYRLKKTIPMAVIMMSQGDKLYHDNCNPSIDRIYDDLEVNDIWVADGHKIDVVTVYEDGSKRTHRLTLSAFMDLRSGVFVGWVITDNPSSQATLLALRKGILNTHTVPRYIYCDNGREYLTQDIGGKGHRTHKRVKIEMPRTILDRLGITMINALPANGQAKHIERDFKDITFISSLFDTYCGSSVTTRPERLKTNLKAGKSPKDSELAKTFDKMIEGYFNHQVYNGKIVADRGKTKIDIYNERLKSLRMPKDEAVLNLMLMRTTAMQTVGKNGVYIVFKGEKLYYKNDTLHWLQGQKVYVRYDPDDLMNVRVYDSQDKLIDVVALNTAMMQSVLSQIEDNNDLSQAMALTRRYAKATKQRLQVIGDIAKEQHGDINVLKLYEEQAEANIRKTTYSHNAPLTEIMYGDNEQLPTAVGDNTATVVDIDRMIKNAERRKDEY